MQAHNMTYQLDDMLRMHLDNACHKARIRVDVAHDTGLTTTPRQTTCKKEAKHFVDSANAYLDSDVLGLRLSHSNHGILGVQQISQCIQDTTANIHICVCQCCAFAE